MHVCVIGSLPAIFIIESIMDHVAGVLKMDPESFREMNLYQQGQVTRVANSGLGRELRTGN